MRNDPRRNDSRKPGGRPGPRGPGGPDRRDSRESNEREATPTRYSPRGEAEFDAGPGRNVLVWQGIPGERAHVRIEHRGENQTYTKWINAKPPHPQRVTPRCEKYTTCGGCPWMHLSLDGQRDARVLSVRTALDEHGIDAPIDTFHPSPDGQNGFRYVVKVAVGESEEGRLKVGAWGRNQRHIVPIPDCHVAAPVLRKAMTSLAHHIIDLDLRPFDPQTGRGVLRSAVLRASRSTGEVMITLIAGRSTRELTDLAEAVAAGCTEVVGVWLHLNDGPGNAIFARDGDGVVGVKPLCGKGTIDETLGGITYGIGPGDFFQTNPAMAEVLYARTIALSGLAEGVPFVDLYGGVGGIALQAARVAGWALGIEEVEGAVHRAREAARRNNIQAEFIAGDVAEEIPEIAKRFAASRPVVCVNPARRGLEPGVVDAIALLKPRRIAYISCNPKAMARDLAGLRSNGFTIAGIELFDMFPNTAHVEALAILDAPDVESVGTARGPRRRVARK